MAGWDIGEKIQQTTQSGTTTGAKYFGTSLAPQAANPNVNKYASIEFLAVGGLVLLAAIFVYKRVK